MNCYLYICSKIARFSNKIGLFHFPRVGLSVKNVYAFGFQPILWRFGRWGNVSIIIMKFSGDPALIKTHLGEHKWKSRTISIEHVWRIVLNRIKHFFEPAPHYVEILQWRNVKNKAKRVMMMMINLAETQWTYGGLGIQVFSEPDCHLYKPA